MNKKILTALLLCGAVTVSGCALPGKKAEKAAVTPAVTVTVAPTPTETPAPTATPTPVPLKTIGEKTEDAYEVQLTNTTGKVIKGFAVKSNVEEAFPESLLKEEDPFADGEERMLYYKPEETEQEQTEKKTYEVQLTFEDDTISILHDFPFTDMKEGEICEEEEIVYLKYESVSTKAPINTKAAEIMAAVTPEPTPTVAPTATPTPTVQTGNSQTSSQRPSYDYDNSNTNSNGNTSNGNTNNGNTSNGNGGTTGGDTDDGNDRIEYEDDDRIFYEDPVTPDDGNTSGGETTDGGTTGGDTSGGDTSGGDTTGGDTSGGDDREVY